MDKDLAVKTPQCLKNIGFIYSMLYKHFVHASRCYTLAFVCLVGCSFVLMHLIHSITIVQSCENFSWVEPVLSNGDKASCSRTQHNVTVGFEPWYLLVMSLARYPFSCGAPNFLLRCPKNLWLTTKKLPKPEAKKTTFTTSLPRE